MTGRTRRWSWLVEEHRFTFDVALVVVARSARNILVPTLQREGGLLMVEERWTPLLRVVARGTVGSSFPELIAVRIFMAIRTVRRGLCKLHMRHRLLQVWRTMTIHTSYCPM